MVPDNFGVPGDVRGSDSDFTDAALENEGQDI